MLCQYFGLLWLFVRLRRFTCSKRTFPRRYSSRIELVKIIMEKEQSTHRGKLKEIRTQKHTRKLKQMKKKRLIIRNLSFKITEDELKKIFSKYGEVLDIALPLTKDGKKRGFAFIQFKDAKSQIKAMKEMNFKKIHDRPIAIDFAVDKTTYQSLRNSTKPLVPVEKNNLNKSVSDDSVDSENADNSAESENEDMESETHSQTDVKITSEDEEDSKVKAFLEEFDANDQVNSEEESSDESSEDDDDDDQSDSPNSVKEEINLTDNNTRNKQFKKKQSEDVSEGKTIFIRNISFNISEEELKEVVQEYGDIEYCLFCKDPLTEQFKGSAFVKFKEKESADKFIEESSNGPGIFIDNRVLNCTYALSREELSKKNVLPEVKDKRNLSLLKHGMIAYGSKESEGVSKTDMSKRAQLEMVKKQKLKNLNFFVSDTRLVIHNLPKNISDKDLYAMFKKAAGKGAVIIKAKVMQDFKKTDAQGVPVSRGFGFVSFTQHEHALKALQELNNNPRIFTSNMRPIVEFSIENKMALLSQERRRERLKMKTKKKRDENMMTTSQSTEQPLNTKKLKVDNQQSPSWRKAKANNYNFQKVKQHGKSSSPSSTIVQETKFKKKQNKKSHKAYQEDNSTSGETQKTSPKKRQKKHLKDKRGKGASINAEEKNNLSVLTNKYKEKLLNKYS